MLLLKVRMIYAGTSQWVSYVAPPTHRAYPPARHAHIPSCADPHRALTSRPSLWPL